VSSHITWKNPPILEVIFEIRFQPVADYAIFVGGMAANNAIQNQYPLVEKLPGSDFPPLSPIEGVVRHKFLTNEKTDILIFDCTLSLLVEIKCIQFFQNCFCIIVKVVLRRLAFLR